ncbi:hypothetical protein E5206_18030 [Arthrobacter sp. PAMC25564]|uniref:hypothetical protein n=1 Tax=Arthrobacter sp. PAMC25564 TaxID=2565366 RepID=UPI0010A21F29|nr:hypothetical protein [Arthrobacter sp. PAMC25564]QCB98571.1 hypothetical protein E5206_18030 [Arthrobacter sp. PAMC25564]
MFIHLSIGMTFRYSAFIPNAGSRPAAALDDCALRPRFPHCDEREHGYEEGSEGQRVEDEPQSSLMRKQQAHVPCRIRSIDEGVIDGRPENYRFIYLFRPSLRVSRIDNVVSAMDAK